MRETVIFSVHRLHIFPVVSIGDFETDPTYGDAVHVPGVSAVGLDSAITNAILRGDGRVIDSRSSMDNATLSFTYSKIAPAALAVLDGGTEQVGAGPSAGTSRYVRTAEDQLGRWGFAALVSEVDNPGGAAKLYGYLATITSGSLFAAADNAHAKPEYGASVIPLPVAPGPIWGTDLEDVSTPLPATGAELIETYGELVTA
jgi:hypothetical protein